MNYDKYKGKGARDVVEHNGRTDATRPHNHSNEDIDVTRSHLNYDLVERENGMSATAFFNREIARIKAEYQKQHGKALRKDAVTLCSWVVTLPKDFTGDEKAFFKESVNFFKERYSECIPVTATVHKDETSPHLHYSFIPIQDGKLKAKDLETRTSLKTAHQELTAYLEERLGCECHLLNGATENGNKTILKMKNEKLQKENEELGQSLKDKENKALDYEPTPKRLTESKGTYEERVKTHQQAVAVKHREQALDEREEQLDERENHFNDEVDARAKRLKAQEYEDIIDNYKTELDKARQERAEALAKAAATDRQNKKIIAENKFLKQEVEQLNFELTGKALSYEEIHKSKDKRGFER